MGIKDIGSDLLKSATGGTEKALLCVYALPKNPVAGSATADSKKKDVESQLKKIQTKMKNIYDIPLKDASGKIMKKTKTESYEEKARKMGLATLQVDYNPSSISFNSQSGQIVHEGVGGAGASLIAMTIPAEIIMNVDLIFDDVNVKDAFMWEKFRLSIGDMVSAGQGISKALSAGKKLGTGEDEVKGYTVQIPIDGIVALMGHQETRQIMFIWNEMIFFGELTNVRARYTMFNPGGNPVRGIVSLSIRQGRDEASLAEMKYWDGAFDKLFKVDDKNRNKDTSADAGSSLSKVGNLIQL